MTLEERIEATARAIERDRWKRKGEHLAVFEDHYDAMLEAESCLAGPLPSWQRPHFQKTKEHLDKLRQRARAILSAAFPELFTEPPSHWLAPWEATKAMCQSVAADNYNFIADDNADAVYAYMRDSYLSHKEPK